MGRKWLRVAVLVGAVVVLVLGTQYAQSMGSPKAQSRVADLPPPSVVKRLDAVSSRTLVRVHGRVVTSSGQAVSNAKVRAESPQLPLDSAAMALTTGDGNFDLGALPRLPFKLSAYAEGRITAFREVDLRVVEGEDWSIEFMLVSCTAKVTGRVMDSAGGPIPFAQVQVAGATGVRTDGSGTYSICVATGLNELTYRADGYGSVLFRGQVWGTLVRNVLLVPAGSLTGRVETEAGGPVANARVVALSVDQATEHAESVTALADTAGLFRLQLSPGQFRIVAFGPGVASRFPVAVSILAGLESGPIVVKLSPHASLSGTVEADGRAVAGAKIVAYAVDGSSRSSEATSDGAGRFFLERILPGEVRFTVFPWQVVSPTRFTVNDEPTGLVRLNVKRLGAVSGLITHGGEIVAGAVVSIGASGAEVQTVSSDRSGHYRIEGLIPGTYRVVARDDASGAFTEGASIEVTDEDFAIDLDLDKSASILGRVVDGHGKPLVGTAVQYVNRKTGDLCFGGVDSDGTFRCLQLAGRGDYEPNVLTSIGSKTRLRIRQPRLVHLQTKVSTVRDELLVVDLERDDIEGEVVDESGAPIPDARVRALLIDGSNEGWNFSSDLPSALTDQAGRFDLSALPKGEYDLEATSPEGAEGRATKIPTHTRDNRIVLKRLSMIRVDASGFTSDVQVQVRSVKRNSFEMTQQDSSGRFSALVAPGEYVVTATAARRRGVKRVVVDGTQPVDVSLQPAEVGGIEGEVKMYGTDAPVAGLKCRAVPAFDGISSAPAWTPFDVSETDSDGKFVLENAPAGNSVVSCVGDLSLITQGSTLVSVSAGERAVVSLAVARRGLTAQGDSGGMRLDPRRPIPVITAIVPRLGGDQVGLLLGDRILTVDGSAVGRLDSDGVRALLAQFASGTQLSLSVARLDHEFQFTVPIGPP